MREVLHDLVVRVGVYRRHQAFFDAECFVQDLRDWSEAIRCAARVADVLHVRRELVVVHAQHTGQIRRILRRCAKHDFLGASLNMRVVARFAILRATGEDARALHNHVDVHFLPGQLGRISHGQSPNLLAVDDQIVAIVAHRAREPAMRAVILEQRGQHLVVREIIDRNDFELAFASVQITKRQPADPTKSVDGDTNSHFSILRHISLNSQKNRTVDYSGQGSAEQRAKSRGGLARNHHQSQHYGYKCDRKE